MSQATNYDVIVIGTSQGGRFLPIAFAKADRKVALIERGHFGGVCVNVGCTPTSIQQRSWNWRRSPNTCYLHDALVVARGRAE